MSAAELAPIRFSTCHNMASQILPLGQSALMLRLETLSDGRTEYCRVD